ncbi:MAG: hypothetical protein H7838_13080, partial [Magnetococcus sp. DMHC-8]
MPKESPSHPDDDGFSLRRPVLFPLLGALLCLVLVVAMAVHWLDNTLEVQTLRRHALILAAVTAGLLLLLGLFLDRLLGRAEQRIRQTVHALRYSDANLAHSHALLHNTLESLEDGILLLNDGQTVRYANSRFATLWNLPEGTLPTRTFESILACLQEKLVDPAPFLDQFQSLKNARQISHGTLHCRDGQVLEYRSFPIPCAREPCDRVWVFHDMTRRAAMEQREEHALQSRIAISALLETGMASLSLEDQLHAALEIILAVPWLSLEYKGSIFL